MTKGTPVHRIVVGLDGSDGSGDALRWAIALARATGADVVAVHAFEVPYAFSRATGFGLLPSTEGWAEAEQRTFEETWCAPLREAGVEHRTVFRTGRASRALCDVAAETAADLMVTGRRGLGSLLEPLAGSVSQHLVHAAPCPVVVVPPVAAAVERRVLEAAARV
jgi:nucleotide-binding universal stress UspA family protein